MFVTGVNKVYDAVQLTLSVWLLWWLLLRKLLFP